MYRLDQMVVKAGLCGCLTIARLTVAGERDQVDPSVTRIRANTPRDLEAVHPGQADVQDDSVRRDVVYQPERRLAVGGPVTDEPGVLQHRAEHVPAVSIVLHDDAGHARRRG